MQVSGREAELRGSAFPSGAWERDDATRIVPTLQYWRKIRACLSNRDGSSTPAKRALILSRLTQSKLFDEASLPPDPMPWELAADSDRLCAEVVLNRPVDTVFHYTVPDKLREMIAVGQRLSVP